jgi:hypothetical protein
MRNLRTLSDCESSVTCAHCALPVDARPFDVSRLTTPPEPGRVAVLASFALPPEYCGVLEYFAQFTDEQANDPARIQTGGFPGGLTWSLRVNQRAVAPYANLGHIVNPWGIGGFPIRLRLDEGAVVDLAVRGESPRRAAVGLVGGRIVGRYWYNRAFGDVERAPAERRA